MNKQNQTFFSGKPPLLIVGASTRAAAFSAVRAGFQPVCVDQYADQDLLEIAEVLPKTDHSSDWVEALNQRPPLDWIYTGALENQPELIEQINQKHRLRGCGSAILRRARNPFFLEQILSQTMIQALPCLPSHSFPSGTAKWLLKPLKGSAGHGIRFADAASCGSLMNEDCYLQRYQPGIPLSALFISFRQVTVLAGISRQFIGNSAFNAAAFHFCGGVTLSPVAPLLRDSLEELGQTIAGQCEIQGLFGCDLLLNPEPPHTLWLTEVNPRYTSLTELFELQYRLPLLSWHSAACLSFERDQPDTTSPEQLQKQLIQAEKQPFNQISKGILYAAEDLMCPEIDWKNPFSEGLYHVPESADIPCPGTAITAGTPLCTVYGRGENQESCLQSLAGTVIRYQQFFEPVTCKPQPASDVFSKLWPLKKTENLVFPGFF
ncbi:MAG: ATP-grasp domain-containing protein [Planctomycetota bacterium]